MLQSGLSESDFSNIQDIIYYSENESVIIPNENSSTTVPNPSNNAIFLALGAYGNNTDPQRVKLYLEVPKIKILDCTSYGYKKGKKSK